MSKTNAAGRKGPKVKVIILLIVISIVIGFVLSLIHIYDPTRLILIA